VSICAGCGRESEGDFAFCPYCGAELKAVPPTRAQRKTVTVVFCDVSGSTALGESTDPEAVRALLARYFERMKGIVESHEGTVEKFIGDAVMAVFGVPQVHEDDAFRAVRAACEMRDALPELGVQARIGLNTGEVVTGTEERLATGDAVNVAARLEQAAQPGEILIGETTLTLVGDGVEAEAVEPLELKGKAEPVPAFRLVSVREAPERRHETPFVGRVAELEALRQAWERVCAERRCELVTVVGDAGVGKSRLTAELLSSIEARSVGGRCLPYGEGITYWPVVEVIKQLDALPSDPAAAASLRSLLGESDEGTSAEEIAWAFRKLLEEQAPAVCLFDDIQWGEETFLDLVEHLALLSRGATILVLCLARPELAERRSEWPLALRLEPLPKEDVDGLIPETLRHDLREKITRVSGGNPLFVTEMVAMAEEATGEVVIPPTLRALLATRLDQLDRGKRSLLERGAVEGEIFHRGAVQALSADVGQVTPRLAALVRSGLIAPHRAQLPGEDGFRFRHLLIRDAAYDALTKTSRAELHQRYAAWLEQRSQNLVELDELLGYHLEQAARYKAELGEADPALAGRARERLAAAGRRALSRSDDRAAAALLARALDLVPAVGPDIHLELDLAAALQWIDTRRAATVAEAAAERAHAAGDETGEALARVVAAHHRGTIAGGAADETEALARAALPLLEEAGDHAGLAHVWLALSLGVANARGRYEDMAHASEQALRHARMAGRRDSTLSHLPFALLAGPRPADEALRTLDLTLSAERSINPNPQPLLIRANLVAMLGRFDEAWSIAFEANERLGELSGPWGEGWLAAIATLAGDHEAAASYLRRLCDFLEERGQRAYLAAYAPALGRSLSALRRYDEAEPLGRLGCELAEEQDVIAQALSRQVQALVHADRGEHAEAAALARKAVAITEQSDSLNWQGDALCDLSEVLATAGDTEEAVTALEQAHDRYERKKNLAMVAQVRPKLEELRKAAPA
jgi:class 3 adenylate cyclase